MERYRIIEECLKDTSKKYTKEDLLNRVNSEMERRRRPECRISFRTIGNDIRDMNAMLGNENRIISRKNGHQTYYRYENESFYIFNTELNEEELENLQTVIKTLSKFRGVAGYGWIDQTMLNLEWKFKIHDENRRRDDILSFDNNERFIGREYIDKVIDAAVRHHPLHITYEPFGREQKDWTIHPWHVKQYNNRWFLFGYVDEEECVRSCALDRIKSLESAKVKFKYNTTIDYRTFFNDVVGVTVPKERDNPNQALRAEDILLKFSDNDYNYVVSKPLHRSQEIISEEEKLISLRLIINHEFIDKLLAFGSQVEVIKPETLRETMGRIAGEMLKKYSD